MCGIIGIASTAAIADRSWLDAGIEEMSHRGPDDRGHWWSGDGRVGFGHLRLAIVDLSSAGHQPMLDEESGLAITFNGEIYNFQSLRDELASNGHAFRSQTDTEVILAAYKHWGSGCVSRLEGMFAFAIYDSQRQTLLVARDRVGEKPLFYRAAEGEIRFASEMKGLLADRRLPRRVNSAALDCYLSLGYVPNGMAMLDGFAKLPPGHSLEFSLETGIARQGRYWIPPALAADVNFDAEVLTAELQTLLVAAVERQMVADVPIGILLSGGLDSSLITACAARARAGVETYTIRFPGHADHDESAHARLIANHFGTNHVEFPAEEGSVDLLPALARQIDEPMADSSSIPTFLVSRLVRGRCTVALGGDGGDELFGGYGYYPKLLDFQQRTRLLPRWARSLAAEGTRRFVPPGAGGSNVRSWFMALDADLATEVPQIATMFDRCARARLTAGSLPVVAETVRAGLTRGEGLIDRATRLDFATYLPDDILVKVDRMSMLNSLETRAPFLDRAVVEFAYGRVPSSLKVAGGQRKILLRRLAERMLPVGFDSARKQGFSIPLNRWLRQDPFRSFFREVLLDPGSAFDRNFLGSLLAGQDRGRDNGERLYTLMMFELWRRHYGVGVDFGLTA